MDKSTLFSYLPKYYQTSRIMDNINNSNAIELDNFDKKLDSTLNQFFVNTADFTLDRWEKELGIPVSNIYSNEFRQSRIKAKLRGAGTITIDLIKNVAESYSNGIVDIIEDNANYCFTVKFVSTLGIPPNIDDLTETIDQIKPAHLAFKYEYTYNTWGFVANKTWGQVANMTWSDLQTFS